MVPSLVVLALAAGAATGERIGVVGFNDSGSHFAAVIAEPGQAEGRLVRVEVQSSAVAAIKERVAMPETQPQLPPVTGFGADPGKQLYKSGTKVWTEIEVGGAKLTVELLTRARKNGDPLQTVAISREKCRRERVLAEPGTDFNLASVWSSRDESALAVVVKYTSKKDGSRRHALVALPLDNDLEPGSCPEPGYSPAPSAADAKRCYQALAALTGAWASVATVKDFEGGATLPKYTVTLASDDAAATVQVDEEPAVGPIFSGPVVQCAPRDAASKVLALTLLAEQANDSFPKVFEIVLTVRGDKKLATEGGGTDFPSAELKPKKR